MPLADLTIQRSGHREHTSRCVRFSSSFCPVPALAPGYRPYAVCGSPSRSGKELHPAEPLTCSRHPPSWRAAPGSDQHPDRPGFQSGDTVAYVHSTCSLTRGPADPVRRYPGRWDVMAQLPRYQWVVFPSVVAIALLLLLFQQGFGFFNLLVKFF